MVRKATETKLLDLMHATQVLSAQHVHVARPVLLVLAVMGSLLGAILFVGGIYLGFLSRMASTDLTLFGNQFSSTSVGVTMAFIGAVMVILTFRKILYTVLHLAALPKD